MTMNIQKPATNVAIINDVQIIHDRSPFEKAERFFQKVKLGGEGEIRTRGTFRFTVFPGLHTRPLCDLSLLIR